MLGRSVRRLPSFPLGGASRLSARLFSTKDFKPSPGFQVYSTELETWIRQQIDTLPASGKLFQNPDGTARNADEAELKTAALLSHLSRERRMSYPDWFRLSKEQTAQFRSNQDDLSTFYSTGRRILDKIPVEDKQTGEIVWTVIREKQRDGWEPFIYYGYIPGALLCAVFALFLDKENVSDWALEELRLRVAEKFGVPADSLSDKERDALIVERIISGEYDRLAGLKGAGDDLPKSLI